MKKLTIEDVNKRIQSRGLSCLEYNGALTTSTFICPNSHIWYALPSNIFAGNGCPTCAGIRRYKFTDIKTELAKRKIECVEYGGTTHSKSTFQCEMGHTWKTTYSHLMKGIGCPWCSNRFPYDLERINREIAMKGITCTFFCGNVKGKSTFECKCGHKWSTRATNVLNKTGCPACSKAGYKSNKPGYLYLLCSETDSSLKVGITNDIKSRISTLMRKTPFEFKLLEYIRFNNGIDAMSMEKEILKSYKTANFSGFDGATEWLLWDSKILKEFRNVKS